MEAADAATLHPDAIFARIFNVTGLQDFEYPEHMHVFKSRIVFDGDLMRTADGNIIFFPDVGSVPSAMPASRCTVAIKAAAGELLLLLQEMHFLALQ